MEKIVQPTPQRNEAHRMNPFASSGDEGRSRYASVGNARYYGEAAERYGRSKTVDTSQRFVDRYERDQFESNHSRGRYRSSGSLDRHYQPRMATEDHHGRRYVDDRSMVQDSSNTVDRMTMPRDATVRREEFRQGMYGLERPMDDRYEHGYGQPAYDRQRYGYDYQPYDRQGYGRSGMNDRLVYDSRYGVDRSHFEDRMTQDRMDQPGRVRFDGDRQSRSNNRRRSSSIARDYLPRKDSRNTEEMRRARSLPPRQSEEAYYVHGSVAKDDKSTGEAISTEKRTASRTGSTKDEQEHSRKSSALDEQARRESKGRQASLPRRESERDIESKDHKEEVQLEKSEVQTEFEDREKQPLSRRESEGRQQALSRQESEARQQQLSRRESESQQQQLSRPESEARQQQLSRRESESQQQQLSRRESEARQQQLSRRESESQQQQLSRRESEARQQAHSRRESESKQQSLSRRESEGRHQALSRRESESRQDSHSRRESEGRQQALSRRESESRQESHSRRESEGRQQALSRRESEGRQQALSRRESESHQESLSRRESEGRQQALSRRESESRQQALSRRESESRQQALSRRESESREKSLSRRDSEGIETALPASDSEVDQESLSRRDSEVQEKPLSRRESESHQQSLSRRDSEGREQSLSRRESEVRQQSLSRRDSEKQEHVSSRRESELREKSLSRRESESESKRESRRQSEERKLSMSRRESQQERSRRSSEKEGSTSRKSSVAAEVLSNDDIQEIKLIVPTGLRSRSQSQQGSERGDGEQEMQRDRVEFTETSNQRGKREGSTRRSVHFGSQYGRDRMPAPIPPYSEPRTTYPTSKDHTTRDNDRSNVRSRELAVRATYDIMRRRYYERSVDPSLNPTWLERGGTADSSYNVSQITDEVLRIEDIDFRCMENAEQHDTHQYELVRDVEQPNPVFRRGKTFIMDITFRDRAFDDSRDNVYVNFYFGPNPSVPKRTRVVLPLRFNTEFQRVPYQWDARVINQEKNTVSVEVSMPVSCPVGMWRCVVDTSTKEDSSSRLQYRCAEDVYVIFNPFAIDDSVFMGDEERRKEFVFNETGKIYTGGYRNVSGRPWIYGQFDDCVLPAVCVLLEMSGLSHAERGNAVKVAKALTSMIKASRFDNQGAINSNGLIEAKYEDSYCGGNSPHLWSGSVQIIEEFLRRGATPVKYGHCWVMTGLMTTLCRALGLPARPVTAFVSAVDTQDSLTIDRFIDRFGDIQEDGPSCDQADSLWSFRTWCDVWMHRADLIPEYSGWQATDPCRTFRDENGVVKGSCGPCPVEALRRGDVGQRDDVDAFFSSMNAYVRYFYEDEESGWGYSPFRQFKYPVSRYVLTKSVGKFDDKGDDDCEDLTSTYRDDEKTDEEKYKTFNSFRGVKDMPAFEYQAAAHNWVEFDPKGSDNRKFDVNFELEMPERVMIGQAFTIPVIVTNNSAEPRTMQTNICTRSSFYTGSLGAYLKRSSTQLTLAPEQSQTVTLTLDPVDYENKLLGMAYVKITVTGFVQETGQSFIDELDFRFNKPCLKIETSPHMKVGGETEAEFSFTNPLDVPLTDCLLTMEMSGSVRPRTIRINRDVRPRESFTLSHSFVTRSAGERQLVACFASRQLSDVVGHRSVMVHQ